MPRRPTRILSRPPPAATPAPPVEREHLRFAAEIPGLVPGRPAWRLSVELSTEAQGDGERLRLRAHLQSHLGEVLGTLPEARTDRPALAHEDIATEPGSGRTLAPAARLAAQGVRLALKLPAVRRLAEPLLRHRIDSWMEVHASTADLEHGAHGLVPNLEPLRQIGIEPPTTAGPLAQTWAGPTRPGADAGVAQVSLLRLDRRDLPPTLAALLGTRPFSLAAAIVNLVEPETARPPRPRGTG